MSLVVAPIVEGHGDVAALPVLLRLLNPSIQVCRPVRFPRTKISLKEQLERAVRIAASNLKGQGVVLLVVDADDDCPKSRHRELEDQMEDLKTGHTCRVVMPVREFEAWIVGGIIDFNIADPENTGRLKERIREHFGVYKETVDQPRLTSNINVDLLADRSRSFRRLRKIIDELDANQPAS